MSGVWFYTLILSFTSGIFLRSFFELRWPVSVWLIFIGVCLLGLVWQRPSPGSARCIWIGSLCAIACALGMLRLEWAMREVPSALASAVGETGEFVGAVVREPDTRFTATHLTVVIGDERVLVHTDRHTPVRYGDVVSVSGKLTKPQTFVTDLGREFDYPGYLASQGIAYVISFARVDVVSSQAGNRLFAQLLLWKESYVRSLSQVIPEPEVGLGLGLLLGIKQALGDKLETDFRKTGVIHIVVLSGYNIMIIVGFVMTLLSWVLPLRARIIAGIISIVVFALLVGAGASVIRASIMASIALIALALGRRYAMLRALCTAGLLMLLITPELLVHDVGFQLSFMATLGLILVAPQFETKLRDSFASIGVTEFLVATLATQIAVLPLLLYHIGEFSVVALLVNLLVLPVVPFAMFATFVTGVVAVVVPGMALPVAYLAYGLLAYMLAVVTWFAALPFAALTVPAFPFVLVPLMYAGMGYFLYRNHLRANALPLYTLPPSVASWTIDVVTHQTKNR